MSHSTKAKTGRSANGPADKENRADEQLCPGSGFKAYHSREINSSKFQNFKTSQTASQNLLRSARRADMDSCDKLVTDLVEDTHMKLEGKPERQRTPGQKLLLEPTSLSRLNSESRESHQHLIIDKLNDSWNFRTLNSQAKNASGQQKSTVQVKQRQIKQSLGPTTRNCPGSSLKVTRSSILASQIDTSTSQKPSISHTMPSKTNLAASSTNTTTKPSASTRYQANIASSQHLQPHAAHPLLLLSSTTRLNCPLSSSTTAATPAPFPNHDCEQQNQTAKKHQAVSQFTEAAPKVYMPEAKQGQIIEQSRKSMDKSGDNSKAPVVSGGNFTIAQDEADEIGIRLVNSGSRFKRIGHNYVQRHSNKKKKRSGDDASGSRHEASNKKQYCDIGDKQLPDKFLSPHSDNEDYTPPIQVDQIKLSKRFNPSEINQDQRDGSKNERQKENSLLSEAINAVNINSSILSNEPVNHGKVGINSLMSHLFQKQDDQTEFKLPMQVKRMDSCFSKQNSKPKHRIYSFGGSIENKRENSKAQKSNESRAIRHFNESNSMLGADQEMKQSQLSNSEYNGPCERQHNQKWKASPSFQEQDSHGGANEANMDLGEEYSFLQDQMEGTEYGANTANDCAESTQGNMDLKYNRKDMSLGKLCRKFLKIYGKEQKGQLLLDQCTQELGVERRRIYDIINILESFSVIRRQAKNSYYWRGIDQIVHSIQSQIRKSQQSLQVQDLSIKGKSKSVVQDRHQNRLQQEKENQDQNGQQLLIGDMAKSIDMSAESQSIIHSKLLPHIKESENASVSMATSYLPNHIELQSDDEEDDEMLRQMQQINGGRVKKYKKDKSLGILCQNFIHLFVTWKSVISLEEAAKRINESQEDINMNKKEQKLKTKIRRLYDIANVLSSLGLIEKCQAINSKKPAFKWIGIEGTIKSLNELKNEPLNTSYDFYNIETSQHCLQSSDQLNKEKQQTQIQLEIQRSRSEIPRSWEQLNTHQQLSSKLNDRDAAKKHTGISDLLQSNNGSISAFNTLVRDQEQVKNKFDSEFHDRAINSGQLKSIDNYNKLNSGCQIQINNFRELRNNQKQSDSIVDQQILGSQSQIVRASDVVRPSNLKSIQNQDITDQLKSRMNVTNSSTMFQTNHKTNSLKVTAQKYLSKQGQRQELDPAGALTPEAATSSYLLKKRGAPSTSTLRRHDQTNGSSSSQIPDGTSLTDQNGIKGFKRSQRLRTEQMECPKKQHALVEEQNTQATVKGEPKQLGKRLNGNLTQIINEIDQKEPHDYNLMKSWLESCEKSQDSSHNGASYQPHKFINEDEENEIVRQVQTHQRQLMAIDPLGELNMALMDRNTASKNRVHHVINPQANNSLATTIEPRNQGKNLISANAVEAGGKSENTDASDSKHQDQAKKRPVRNKNNSFTEEESSQGSDKQSRKKSQKLFPVQNPLNKRQVKQTLKGRLSQVTSPLKEREAAAISSQKRDEDIQISGKSVRSQNITEWTDKNKGADLNQANGVSEMTSVKLPQDQLQNKHKKQVFQSELLFGFAPNMWKHPMGERNLRKVNSGTSTDTRKSQSSLNDFESHTSKMICLSSMIDFTNQLEFYRKQRETLYGLFKDLACQQNS